MYFRCKASSEADHCVLVKGLTPPGPVYTPKYIRLSFGAARSDVSIAPISMSSTSLKFFYGGSTYGDIGKYLTGSGSVLNFPVVKAITKSGSTVDNTGLVARAMYDTGASYTMYLYNNSDSAVSVSTVYIEIPRYTYAVYSQGGSIYGKKNYLLPTPNGYAWLLGVETWNYEYLPVELYKLMGAQDNMIDCEIRNDDGTYESRPDLKILIGSSYLNIYNISDAMIYNIPSCRFETWLPEMYRLVNGEMILIGASALSLEEE